MDLFEAIRTRRSIRKYLPDPVSDEDIVKMLESATMAPSSDNLQPWRFVVIRDQQTIKDMAQAVHDYFDARIAANPGEEKRITESNSRFFATHFGEAPLVIIALARGQMVNGSPDPIVSPSDLQSVAAAIQNILLAATALGYGTCWMTGPVENARERLMTMLGVEPTWRPIACIPVGRIKYHPRPRPCKPVEEISVVVGEPLPLKVS